MNIQALHELHSLCQSIFIESEICIMLNGDKIHLDLELNSTIPIFELVQVLFTYYMYLSYYTF